MTKRKTLPIILTVMVAVVVFALPLMIPSASMTFFAMLVLTAIIVTGVTLLMGYTNQVSLGQGAFFAISALVTALLAQAEVPPIVAFLVGPTVAGLFAAVVGYPLTRLRGHYLAFGTLALQIIVITVATNTDWFGGPFGIQAVPQFSIGGFEIKDARGYVYFALIMLALVLFVAYRVVHSRFGRGIRAMSVSESAAASAGIPIARYRLTVFVLSAVFAGFAGAIYPFLIGYVSASSFPIITSFQYVAMAVIGGAASLWGGVVGVAIVMILIQWLSVLGTTPGMPETAPAILSYAVYAVALILVIMLIPQGLVPWVTSLFKRRGDVDPSADSATSLITVQSASRIPPSANRSPAPGSSDSSSSG
ncbi:MAG: branched-chain amino acid ABC transporter permease [Leucobacter sp.]